MNGWRARIGVIVPSSNTTVEPEFSRTLPPGVSVHAARMALEGVTAETLDSMAEDTERCAELLGHAAVDAIAYACTTGSLVHGRGFDAELEERIERTAGCPARATALSVGRALRALDCNSVVLVTPYVPDLTEREVEYLESHDVEVLAADGREIEANTEIGRLGPEDAYRQVRRAVERLDENERRAADAVFVSCTNYRTFPAIVPLERDFGLPVVTSNAATLWDVLRVVGVDPEGPGELFARA